MRKALNDALKQRKIGEDESGEKISISSHGIAEPIFRHATRGGKREYVSPGNRKYVVGDKIERPSSEESGGRGGSPEDNGEMDAFDFALSKDEFLDLLFEDLALPDLVKTRLKEMEATQLSRAGFSVSGAPTAINLVRTMRNSFARRLCLHRPTLSQIENLEHQVTAALSENDAVTAERCGLDLEMARRRTKSVAYIDPVDVRYNRFDNVPRPTTRAVMFCLMDVSGSMTEAMKDLAKRFFLLLHVFLTRQYERVEIVFVRHTSNAQEVDEDTFFHSRETGGTIVSTALEQMIRVVHERYNPDEWNIYAAQASDGDNYAEDNQRCSELLDREILPLTQYFAYIEVGAEATLQHGLSPSPTDLWRAYSSVSEQHENLAMRKVADKTQIFPVFHDLFAKQRELA
jgi:uncharacterized sporulation protein YeaH/YhbH (DUF444 family)